MTLEEYEAEYRRQFRERVIDDYGTISRLDALKLTGGRKHGAEWISTKAHATGSYLSEEAMKKLYFKEQ